MLVFFPLVLALGMGWGILCLGYLAVGKLRKFGIWLYPYVSPPIKWSLRRLSWPLRITWFALKGIVPSFRYMYRARLKWVLVEESVSASLDLEKGREKGRRYASSSGSILSMAKPHKARIETPPNLSNRSLALNSSTW